MQKTYDVEVLPSDHGTGLDLDQTTGNESTDGTGKRGTREDVTHSSTRLFSSIVHHHIDGDAGEQAGCGL